MSSKFSTPFMAKSPLANKEGIQEVIANAAANAALEQLGANTGAAGLNAGLNAAAANAAGAAGANVGKGLPSDRSKAVNEEGEIVNALTGLTEDQQIAANLAEKEKQSNNADLFGAYKDAQNALRAFENDNPGAPFGDFVDEAMKNKYLQLEAARTAARKAYKEIQ
jgi:hypothetical protein